MQQFSNIIISETEFYIAIFIGILVLTSYQFILINTKHDIKITDKNCNTKKVLNAKFIGFILFGIIPAASVFIFLNNKVDLLGLNKNFNIYFWVIICFSPALIIVSYFNSKRKDNLCCYPQIRKASWTIRLFTLNISSWILYLFAYELLFRGYLLIISVSFIGIWPAVILNVILYALAHVKKGIKETALSIPFGLVLILSVLYTGNIWAAFILHSALAVSNAWFSLKHHPQMNFAKK